jgi:hypothetical protein
MNSSLLSIKPVTVQGPRGIERNYDVCYNDVAIKGARHQRKRDAEAEQERMAKVLEVRRV